MRNTMNRHRLISLMLALLMVLSLALPALAEQERELRLGDSGPEVLTMQERLIALHYLKGPASGSFDQATEQALKLFQRGNNLLITGTLDRFTRAALYAPDAVPLQEDMALESDGAPAHMPFLAPGGVAMDAAMVRGILPYPSFNTSEYNAFQENRFLSVRTSPLSTFAADVDTASYAQLRRMILEGSSVPADAVRIEEMLNYFRYAYQQPQGDAPFGVSMALAKTPWNEQTLLLQIGLQAAEIQAGERPPQNLVFLLDVSGSMDAPDKLPLVKRAFLMLLDELQPTDTVSLVTYASREEVVLEGRRASDKTAIMAAISDLTAGGSTHGSRGITTAYELARKHFIKGGNNRVLLATDGDLNVGITDEGALARLVEQEKQGGIFLSVLGFGTGNLKDNKMEALADRGDGNYSYIDTIHEARRALVTEIGATFFTVAKDVKLQVDFNPAFIKGYRLIGYENRVMNAEDFADDRKDGGELGSGHRLTVLYELVPVGSAFELGGTGSKYTEPDQGAKGSDEMLTLSIRAKKPDGDESKLYSYPLVNQEPAPLSDNQRFAAAVAMVGMLLRDSEWKGTASYAKALELLRADTSLSGDTYKEEFLYLVTLLERAQGK